jgi:hypothetical protein
MDDAFLLDAGIVERKSKCVIQNNWNRTETERGGGWRYNEKEALYI